MTIIHIKATQDVDNEIICELGNILLKKGFIIERYMGINSKILMARKEAGK